MAFGSDEVEEDKSQSVSWYENGIRLTKTENIQVNISKTIIY